MFQIKAHVLRMWSARCFFGVLLLAAVLAPASSVRAQLQGADLEGKTVLRVEFQGLRLFTKKAVMARMRIQEGRPFSREALEDDLRSLAGHTTKTPTPSDQRPAGAPEDPPLPPTVFSTIPSARAAFDAATGKVIVSINGLENRRVAGVVFLGAVEYRREELLPLVRTRQGSPVDDFTLELDRQELKRYYTRQGHYYAEVDITSQTEPAGDLIIFKITEGPEVEIRKVTLRGAKSFDKDELLANMPFTDEPGLFSSKAFQYEQVKRDAKALEYFYQGNGYLDARVELLEATPSVDHESVDCLFDVDEGEPYIIRSLNINGLTLFDAAEILPEWRSKVGVRYEPGFKLRLDIRDLKSKLNEFGYTEAEVEDQSTKAFESNEVDLVINVAEGALVRVGEVRFIGHVETQDRVLRRELELYTGEPLNMLRLRRGRSRIRALGYWTVPRGVNVDTPPIEFQPYQIYTEAYPTLRDTQREDIKDVVVSVEEQDTGSLRFAAGIGSNSGVLGDITYTKTNFDPFDWPESLGDTLDAFTGGGQTLILSLQPGTQFSRARIAWSNPRLFDGPWSLSIEGFLTQWIREDWDEERVGGSIRVGRRLTEDLSGALTLRDEFITTNDIDNDAPQLVFDFEGERRLTGLQLDLRLNRLNDWRNPSDGYLVETSVEHAGLWGDIEFNRVLARGDYYFELYEDSAERLHVMRFRGQVGWADEFGDARNVPVYERFYVGGQGSLRGFRFRGIGPMDNDSPIGGKAMWVAGAEYQFPLVEDTFRGVAFIDAGSLAEDWSSDEISDVRLSVGIGFRVIIPFLSRDRPLAIDFGIPLIKRNGDETEIISFSFGSR